MPPRKKPSPSRPRGSFQGALVPLSPPSRQGSAVPPPIQATLDRAVALCRARPAEAVGVLLAIGLGIALLFR